MTFILLKLLKLISSWFYKISGIYHSCDSFYFHLLLFIITLLLSPLLEGRKLWPRNTYSAESIRLSQQHESRSPTLGQLHSWSFNWMVQHYHQEASLFLVFLCYYGGSAGSHPNHKMAAEAPGNTMRYRNIQKQVMFLSTSKFNIIVSS